MESIYAYTYAPWKCSAEVSEILVNGAFFFVVYLVGSFVGCVKNKEKKFNFISASQVLMCYIERSHIHAEVLDDFCSDDVRDVF